LKTVLIIDEADLFREYLTQKLEAQELQVISAINGLDGIVKMRNSMPDLVIMDYYLTRKSSMEVLKEKAGNPNVAKIPVIMVSSKISKERILEIARLGIKKFFSKPVNIDTVLQAVGEVLKIDIKIDSTPCVIEAHFNEDILFIEAAMGLNREKIDVLKYKLKELLGVYDVKIPKVLLMLSNIEINEADYPNFKHLLDTVIQNSGTNSRLMKILTKAPSITNYLKRSSAYAEIDVIDSLEKAMDELLGLKPDLIAHDTVAHEKLLSSSAPKTDKTEHFEMRYTQNNRSEINVAIVDDDEIIHALVKTALASTGWNFTSYQNGKLFIDDLKNNDFDLVFLDLVMPEMNGFAVLDTLKQKKTVLPIVILSALSKKETVVKAMEYRVHTYLIKPLKPEKLLKKAMDVVGSSF
jgi:DNA-binding response OmpR family regulator